MKCEKEALILPGQVNIFVKNLLVTLVHLLAILVPPAGLHLAKQLHTQSSYLHLFANADLDLTLQVRFTSLVRRLNFIALSIPTFTDHVCCPLDVLLSKQLKLNAPY